MSQTGSMARRVLEAAAVGALALGVLLAAALVGPAPASAGSPASQILGTTTATTPGTSSPPVAPAPGYATHSNSQPATTTAPTTTTTIAALGNSLPVSPATLPLRTTGGDAHVEPVFAVLSGIGFLVALLIVAGRLFVTRAGGPDRRPSPPGGRQVGAGAQVPVSRSS